jgi:serine/threonine protein kinase/outer membrane protein assembly factor BamD (BamD/ComL family)
MTPERWQQIDNLLQEALDHPVEEFEARLNRACARDDSLREEVVSLIRHRELAESFLEVPAFQTAAELLSERRTDALLGTRIGPYTIEAQLGAGGMSEVYLAGDTKLDRKVAIKFLPPYLEADSVSRKRLIREARAAAKLDHPNICSIYEIAEDDHRSYIVMQYVEGETLGSRLERETLDLLESSDIACQVADALAEAHSQGIIHRDIKPQNVMITPRGQVKVLDFGLAKRVEVEGRDQVGAETETLLSAPGLIVGTAPYMSPEQAKGSRVDARSDLFSLGAMLYECVTGRPPFTGETAMEIRAQVIHIHPVAPSQVNPDVSPGLDALILKAIAKEPKARYQSAGDFRKDLRALREAAPSEDHIKTRSISLKGYTAKASAFSSVSQALRRPRVFIPAVSVVVALAAILIIAPRWRTKPTVPSREATHWYEAGTNAMRNGSYYQASKALQRAVETDDEFALAHARLAEAYTELDYADKADHEILRARALVHDLSPLPQLDSLYLQAITHTVLREYSAAVASYKETAAQVSDPAKPQAQVDLGRAYERNDELDKAKESYARAIQLAPSDAAAFLRLGGLCGQQQDFKCADEGFRNAEKLYHDLGDFEGVTEVVYQRGLLLKNSERPHDARIQLEEALKLTQTTGSIYQQVRALLALSSVAATEGQTNEAQQHANQAISLAQANHIENQATSGLIWLGNAFLLRGDYEEAEKYYQQGLELARRDNGRHNEALALVQLGSLRMQQRKTDEALRYIEQALPFFKQAGYRKELSQVLILKGRANRDKGDSEAALAAFKEQLKLGEQAGDVSQMALAHEEIGSVLAGREDYAQALQHFDKSYELNKSLRADVYVGYAAMHRASVLWQIGRYQEAKDALAEAVRVAQQPEGDYKHLLASVHMVRGLMEASAWRSREAKAESNQALALAGSQYKPTIIQAKTTISLAQARSGAGAAALRAGTLLCEEALDLATQTGDPQLLANTLLASAETILASGDARRSLEMALRAQQSFSSFGQLDSEWRAWLIAASASQNQGEETKAREYTSYATGRQVELEKRLGSEAYKGYLSRPDIQHFNQRLAQIVNMKG